MMVKRSKQLLVIKANLLTVLGIKAYYTNLKHEGIDETLLPSLFFLININNTIEDIHSHIRLFADDTRFYNTK